MWTDTFDAFFFITAGGLVLAAFKYGVEYCLKSKCSEFQFCCIRIKRDVRVEADIEQANIQARIAGAPEPVNDPIVLPQLPHRRSTV